MPQAIWPKQDLSETPILQANDDVLGFVDGKGQFLEAEAVRAKMQELLNMMIWNNSWMGWFCPNLTCMRNTSKWMHGNVFVPEHLCVRVVNRGFDLSTCWSKIDLERRVCYFVFLGDDLRSPSFVKAHGELGNTWRPKLPRS
ncbi:hypothetical protein AK812_SmicGene13909 [Symbiodinium microadriaticum]|uniref:Uncharacterized protein n=1 Tax=Symbiodinium microadriaticum TaxID=2951 RepID=A0A1Q9E6X7_SYMMI|nr:hypothetical protein AK812_SmicGene13909 [Symbiodinium microadriaticum]CAE7845846.1 unnamed protein product [Symbiodinium sp. KB8]